MNRGLAEKGRMSGRFRADCTRLLPRIPRDTSAGAWTWRSAFVGAPEVIFLGEPTTAFDRAARRQAWSTIHLLCELGKTLFRATYCTHEAQHLTRPRRGHASG